MSRTEEFAENVELREEILRLNTELIKDQERATFLGMTSMQAAEYDRKRDRLIQLRSKLLARLSQANPLNANGTSSVG